MMMTNVNAIFAQNQQKIVRTIIGKIDNFMTRILQDCVTFVSLSVIA